jgi:GNAT superfamily N-acetyltransferase
MTIVIRPLDDLDAMRRLGVSCGLEDEGRGDETIVAAWGAFDGDELVGTVALERYAGLDTANWLAVRDDHRRLGIAAALYAEAERAARARGIRRLSVTARSPAFWIAQGYEALPPGPESDALLGGCLDCDQYGRGCTPEALTKSLEKPGRSAVDR